SCAQPSANAAADPSLQTPEAFPRFPPVAPSEVSRTFVVQHGFQMQLVAAEPLVTDPVAMAIDEDGRAYVVEMNDYPYTNPKTHRAWEENTTDAPLGRVRMLEDADGDGVYDRSTVFAEQLSWPSGVICYRGGVFVTATPDIWYLKDTDGDRVADQRQRVFTGFRKYNVQAVMNNPIWGLDNHIYVAGSSNGGSVLEVGQTQKAPIAARGDFRIDPQSHQFELQAGGARFGNTFDDWGNRFLCNIRNPAIHVVLDNRYLARNPFYAAPSAAINIAESGDQMPVYRISPVEPWRELRGRQWSADATKKVPRSELTGGGVFTSTSGVTVYRGHAYPEAFAGQMFEGEVANNTIYRQRVVADGNTFQATRADAKVEFVASTDTWFRPVNLFNAPDGTLLVLDMYREFIEHPWSIPDDIHARLDLTSGRDRGRIYRLAPPGFSPSKPPALGRATSQQLVAHLGDPDSWWRETAQRLLVERGDRSAAPALRKLLEQANPRAAMHALWTLVGIGAATEQDLDRGLSHVDPHVREQAIRAAEPRLESSSALRQRVMHLTSDPGSRVRLQAALSLGGIRDPEVVAALARAGARDAGDPWMRSALGSALPEHTTGVTLALLGDEDFVAHPQAAGLVEQLAAIIGAKGDMPAAAQLEQASRDLGPLRDALWQGLGSGAKRKGRSLSDLLSDADASSQRALEQFLQASNGVAHDADRSESDRIEAIGRIAFGPFNSDAKRLAELIDPSEPDSLQIAAIRSLASFKSDQVAEELVARVMSLTPAVREEAFAALLARPERSLALLHSIDRGELAANQLGLSRKAQLLSSTSAAVKELAQRVLGQSEEARAAVIERYAISLNQAGDVVRGRAVFAQHCAACHRADGQGVEIGPHLETVRAWDRSKLLLNILDPSREVAPQAMAYAILLTDGRVINGLIADETASSLT
ncbi:MAG: PVC-type heme-binding CxxCH protein, partial [Aureliella sp.]